MCELKYETSLLIHHINYNTNPLYPTPPISGTSISWSGCSNDPAVPMLFQFKNVQHDVGNLVDADVIVAQYFVCRTSNEGHRSACALGDRVQP